jgi:hypothetical protein
VRYSTINLNDRVSGPSAVAGGFQNVYAVGVNWYPNANIRFLFDFLHGDVSKRFATGAPSGGGIAGRQILEPQVRTTGERQVDRAQKLTDVIDAGHTNQLHVRMQQQTAHNLRPAISAAADHSRAETFHRSIITHAPPRTGQSCHPRFPTRSQRPSGVRITDRR